MKNCFTDDSFKIHCSGINKYKIPKIPEKYIPVSKRKRKRSDSIL